MLVLQSESAEVAAEVPIDQEQEQEDATSAVAEEKEQVAKGSSTYIFSSRYFALARTPVLSIILRQLSQAVAVHVQALIQFNVRLDWYICMYSKSCDVIVGLASWCH